MSIGYQITNPIGVYYVAFTVVEWVDLFTRKSYRDVLLDNLAFYQQQRGLAVFAYVVMTNHMHLILQQPEGALSHTIRDYKKFTSRTMAEMVEKEPESRRAWLLHRFEWNAGQRANVTNRQIWTHENHAVEITSRKVYEQKENYIHMNPVRAGWVEQPEHWIYSSAWERLQTPVGLSLLHYRPA